MFWMAILDYKLHRILFVPIWLLLCLALGYVQRKKFNRFCDLLFKLSQEFILSFGNYYLWSVIICLLVPLQITIDREIPLADGQVVFADDEENTFLEENELDIDRLIYDEILVNWPTKVLCKDDCKGICPVCGQNLNQQDCGCDRQVIDPRMAKFQDIFNEFKEV